MIMEVESVNLGPLRFAALSTGELAVTMRGVEVLLNARQVAELRELLRGSND